MSFTPKAPGNLIAADAWRRLPADAHFAHFYDEEAPFIDLLSGFIGSGMFDGAAAVIIATPERIHALERSLVHWGIDVAAARAWGQFVSLDAATTLQSFMHDGMPDEALFRAAIEPVIALAQRKHRRVVAFGEMVALLWRQGARDAAIALERLWNVQVAQYNLSLFCAYPASDVVDEADAVALAAVCSHHSAVLASRLWPHGHR